MKTKYYFFAALAGLTLASCSSNDFVGDNSPNDLQNGTVENDIRFSSGTTALTRADLYGSAAATKLSEKFVVYGIKHVSDEGATATNDAVVFNNFQVGYTANTAGTTASNSSDWEYVGLQAYDATPTSQGIKYWDYSADKGYTFYAFSSSNISYPANPSDLVSVEKVTADNAASGASLYNKGYKVTLKEGASLNNLYFSDRVEVSKGDYGKTVDLTFRNIGAQVRVGFYETIPGYSVKIDNFYIDNGDPKLTAPVTNFAAMNDPMTDGFYASLQNVTSAKTGVSQTLNVTYYPATTATEVINRPKLTNPTAGYDYSLKLGDGSGFINTTLGTVANSPTWAVSGGAYTPVFPFEANSQPLLIKLDFTMYADDDSSDVIHVRGARAIVPVQYVQWKSNFAYTYLFKISDKSNGTTGDVDANDDPITDPEGLKPITFDAIVVDITDERQETITSVSTNSITTYADGAIVNEYSSGKEISVAISNNADHSVITPSAIGNAATQAQVYSLSKAAATEADVLAQLTGSPMDITMTAVTPAATTGTTVTLKDGTTPSIPNVKFTPSAAGTYAYVYTTTAYIAPTYTVQTSGTYSSGTTYYMLSGSSGSGAYFAVTVPTEAAFNANKSSLYIKATDGTPGVYDVKVIKVQ